MSRIVKDPTTLQDLGRFARLEELHIQLHDTGLFQWIIDAKASGTVTTEYDDNLHHHPVLLPRLKKLCLTIVGTCNLALAALNHTLESLGPQLQDLIVNFEPFNENIILLHPLPILRHLTLRGHRRCYTDCSAIAQHCPLLESLVIQQPKYGWPNTDIEVIDHLVRIP